MFLFLVINFLILSPPFKKTLQNNYFSWKRFVHFVHIKYIYIKNSTGFFYSSGLFSIHVHTQNTDFLFFYFFLSSLSFRYGKKKMFCLKKSNVTRFSLIFYFYLNEIPPCVVYLEKHFCFTPEFFFFFWKNDFFCVCVFLTHEKQCFSWFFFFPLVSDVEILKWNIVGFKGWFFAFMSTNIDFIMFKWFYRNVMKTEVWDWEYPPSPTDKGSFYHKQYSGTQQITKK